MEEINVFKFVLRRKEGGDNYKNIKKLVISVQDGRLKSFYL